MKNFAWNAINVLSNKGFLLIFSLILGNVLTPYDLGAYLALMMVVNYVSTLFSFEIGSGVVQKLNRCETMLQKQRFYSAGLMLTIGFSMIITLLLLLFREQALALFRLENNSSAFLIILPLIPIRFIRGYYIRILQSMLIFKKVALVNLSAALLQIIITLILYYFGWKLDGIITSIYAANIFAVILSIMIVKGLCKYKCDRQTIVASKELINFSLLIYIGTIAVFLDSRIDIFFVNFFLSKDQVAIYNYAIQFALVFLLFSNSISQVNYPKLTRAFWNKCNSEVNTIYSNSITISFFIISLSALFLIYFIKFLIILILPDVYLEIIPSLKILLPSISAFATISSVGSILTAAGYPAYGALGIWICLFVNVGLNIVLIPRYGIAGAAISTAISFFLRAIITIFIVEHKIKLDFKYFRIVWCYLIYIVFFVGGTFVDNSFSKFALLIVYSGVLYFGLFDKKIKILIHEKINNIYRVFSRSVS